LGHLAGPNSSQDPRRLYERFVFEGFRLGLIEFFLAGNVVVSGPDYANFQDVTVNNTNDMSSVEMEEVPEENENVIDDDIVEIDLE
jgi:hypothetical protein